MLEIQVARFWHSHIYNFSLKLYNIQQPYSFSLDLIRALVFHSKSENLQNNSTALLVFFGPDTSDDVCYFDGQLVSPLDDFFPLLAGHAVWNFDREVSVLHHQHLQLLHVVNKELFRWKLQAQAPNFRVSAVALNINRKLSNNNDNSHNFERELFEMNNNRATSPQSFKLPTEQKRVLATASESWA